MPQPEPVATLVCRLIEADGPVTVIARAWLPGDGARCRRCPPEKCSLDSTGTLCQQAFPEDVPDSEAIDKGCASAVAVGAGLVLRLAHD